MPPTGLTCTLVESGPRAGSAVALLLVALVSPSAAMASRASRPLRARYHLAVDKAKVQGSGLLLHLHSTSHFSQPQGPPTLLYLDTPRSPLLVLLPYFTARGPS